MDMDTEMDNDAGIERTTEANKERAVLQYATVQPHTQELE